MQFIVYIIFILLPILSYGQAKSSFFSFGIDFRQYPIDIENQPRGALPGSKGLPSDDSRFWNVLSVHGSFGFRTENKWLMSFTCYTRYNLLHRKEGINLTELSKRKPAEMKNFKYDIFLDVEKKLNVKKSKVRYFFVLAGIGFTNIITRFDIILTDTTENGPLPPHHYKGSFFHFTPRISIGYQFEKIKASLDAYIIEGPDRTGLTSLWSGATICYELYFRRKKF